jgi:hypothetical protein
MFSRCRGGGAESIPGKGNYVDMKVHRKCPLLFLVEVVLKESKPLGSLAEEKVLNTWDKFCVWREAL